MKGMRLHAINQFTLDEIDMPFPGGDEILIKVSACGICGSDIPRVFELGTRVYPVVLGHEFSGTVVAAANESDQSLIGKTAAVFPLIPCGECEDCRTGHYALCQNYDYLGSRSDGGFAEYCLVPSRWHLVFSSNEETSKEDLALVEPAAVAQHALRQGSVNAGDTVLIIGAGPIGIMAARWARIFGAGDIVLMDIDEKKIAFAKERGFTVINPDAEDYQKLIKERTGGKGMRVVIEGTGTSAGLGTAIDCIRTRGRIVMLGNPHKDTVIALNRHSQILRKELTLTGVWNSYYAEAPLNEWQYTVDMIDQGQLEVADLITHRSSLIQLSGLFKQIYNREITICKAIYSAAI